MAAVVAEGGGSTSSGDVANPGAGATVPAGAVPAATATGVDATAAMMANMAAMGYGMVPGGAMAGGALASNMMAMPAVGYGAGAGWNGMNSMAAYGWPGSMCMPGAVCMDPSQLMGGAAASAYGAWGMGAAAAGMPGAANWGMSMNPMGQMMGMGMGNAMGMNMGAAMGMGMGMGMGAATGMIGGSLGTAAGVAPPPPVGESTEELQGTVKSFNEEKGWGHISCDTARQLYGKDVFVLRSALRGCKITGGHKVRFTWSMTERGPQANEVRSLEAEHDDAQKITAGKSFIGTIKQYDDVKSWGFITCNETHVMFGKDMFVHKREFGENIFKPGDVVQFTIGWSQDDRPEAHTVSRSSEVPTPFKQKDAPAVAAPAIDTAIPAGAGTTTVVPDAVDSSTYGAVREEEKPSGTARSSPY